MIWSLAIATCLLACGSSAAPPSQPTPPLQPTVAVIANVSPGIELPEVAHVGYVVADDATPTIAVSPTSFTFSGKSSIPMRDGILTASDREGLVRAIGPEIAASVPVVTLSFDRRIPFQTLAVTLGVLAERGANRYRLLARAGANQVAVPFERYVPPPADVVPFPHSFQQPDPKPSPGSGMVSEDLQSSPNKAQVVQEMRRKYFSVIRACYLKSKTATTASGKVRIELAVAASGKVAKATVTGWPEVARCIEGRAKAWTFTPPKADVTVVVPVAFQQETAAAPPPPPPVPVGMRCTVTDKQILIWSTSGQEGTRELPKVTIERAAGQPFVDLTTALTEIAKRRWPSGARGDDERIILELEPAAQIQLVAEVLGAVRDAPDGFPLFPTVQVVVP